MVRTAFGRSASYHPILLDKQKAKGLGLKINASGFRMLTRDLLIEDGEGIQQS